MVTAVLEPAAVHIQLDRGGARLFPRPDDAILSKRFEATARFARRVALFFPSIEVERILYLNDEGPTPAARESRYLVFNRPLGQTGWDIFPDPHFTRQQGYWKKKLRFDLQPISWGHRRPQAIWRGSSTGGGLQAGEDPLTNARVRLCVAAKDMVSLLDARLGRVVNASEEGRAALASLDILGDFLSPEKQRQYRYVVSIDGFAGEWEGLVWKLYSGSVVLRVDSRWEQWYTAMLEPWTHFVPVAGDLSDLEERIRWCQAHDGECRAIAGRARRFVRDQVSFSASLRAAARAFRPDPARA